MWTPDAGALGEVRPLSRVQRLSRVQERAPTRQAGGPQHPLPAMSRRLAPGEKVPPRQDLLWLQPLSGVQFRDLGSSGCRGVSEVRQSYSGRESNQKKWQDSFLPAGQL